MMVMGAIILVCAFFLIMREIISILRQKSAKTIGDAIGINLGKDTKQEK
jgi:hypothetical protein